MDRQQLLRTALALIMLEPFGLSAQFNPYNAPPPRPHPALGQPSAPVPLPKPPIRNLSVYRFKLLTPTVGWAETDQGLLMTTTAGATWEDISPKTTHIFPSGALDGEFADIFFVDPATGWALFSYPTGPGDDGAGLVGDRKAFDLYRTTDGGKTWSTSALQLPDLNPVMTEGSAHMVFADTLHGWINVNSLSSSAHNYGVLYATADGGRTWQYVESSPGYAGPILPLASGGGWLLANGGRELYRLDSRKARKISLPDPEPSVATITTYYTLPHFEDEHHGYEAVTFSKFDLDQATAVLFRTEDGGATWHSDRTLTGLNDLSMGAQSLSSSVVNGTWVVPFELKSKPPEVLLIPSDSKIKLPHPNESGGTNGFSFLSTAQGWVEAAHDLLSTFDGGASWHNITPTNSNDHSPRALTSEAADVTSALSSKISSTVDVVYSASLAPGISKNLAFDYYTVPAVSDMQKWWNASPYYEFGFYANGGESHKVDVNQTPAWVAAVASQGWGLIPIWSGLQAPCACWPAKLPACQPFPHTFSYNPTAAYSQGKADALKAFNSVKTLGLDGTIIYSDVEQYASSAACGASARSFVSGWVDGMHGLGGSAGVYGSPANAATDFANAASVPDEVWFSHYDHVATVWNAGFGLADMRWPKHQRIKQYDGRTSQSWGGVRLGCDVNIVDAPVYASQGKKTYTFPSQVQIGYPGVTYSYLTGINDGINNATSKVLTPHQAVGDYESANGNTSGFMYNGSSFGGIISAPNSYSTYALQINNQGLVVGRDLLLTYDNIFRGFVFDATKKTMKTMDYPGYSTSPFGVNDAGWIVGFYQDSSSTDHCFLEKYGVFTPFDSPAGPGTVCLGINGVGQIVGQDDAGNGFIDDVQDGSNPGASANFSPLPSAFVPRDINNNGHISSYNPVVLVDGTIITLPNSQSSSGINNDTQTAGGIGPDPVTSNSVGVIASPPH